MRWRRSWISRLSLCAKHRHYPVCHTNLTCGRGRRGGGVRGLYLHALKVDTKQINQTLRSSLCARSWRHHVSGTNLTGAGVGGGGGLEEGGAGRGLYPIALKVDIQQINQTSTFIMTHRFHALKQGKDQSVTHKMQTVKWNRSLLRYSSCGIKGHLWFSLKKKKSHFVHFR